MAPKAPVDGCPNAEALAAPNAGVLAAPNPPVPPNGEGAAPKAEDEAPNAGALAAPKPRPDGWAPKDVDPNAGVDAAPNDGAAAPKAGWEAPNAGWAAEPKAGCCVCTNAQAKQTPREGGEGLHDRPREMHTDKFAGF